MLVDLTKHIILPLFNITNIFNINFFKIYPRPWTVNPRYLALDPRQKPSVE